MIYDDLARLVGYDTPIIEIYNKKGEVEYILDLESVYFDDVDIVYTSKGDIYGIIKLKRGDEKSKLNGKDV